MTDPKTNKPRAQGTTLSLENVIRTLPVDVPCQYHNSGNDAFMCLFALQKLLDPDHTEAPVPKKAHNPRFGPAHAQGGNPKTMGWVGVGPPAAAAMTMNGMMPVPVPTLTGLMPPPISMVPVPMPISVPVSPYTPGINLTPAATVEDYLDAGNVEAAAAQVRRLPGRARVASSPGISNSNGKPTGAGAHMKRHSGGGQTGEAGHKQHGGRAVDGVNASMRSMALNSK